MTIRKKITMPRIGPIRWRADGYGTQVLKFSAAGTCLNEPVGGEEIPRDPIQRGYVKIWSSHGPEHIVVDRALTVAAARRRIEHLKKCR